MQSEYSEYDSEEEEEDKGPSKADIVRKQTEEKAAKEAFESKKAYEENKAYEKQIQVRKN
jgi:hypothetical protein